MKEDKAILISIIAIVAIVGIIGLFLANGTNKVYVSETSAERENLAGQAVSNNEELTSKDNTCSISETGDGKLCWGNCFDGTNYISCGSGCQCPSGSTGNCARKTVDEIIDIISTK
jgi:hypothetical protein